MILATVSMVCQYIYWLIIINIAKVYWSSITIYLTKFRLLLCCNKIYEYEMHCVAICAIAMNVFMFWTDNCHNITTLAITSNHLQQQKIHVENDTAATTSQWWQYRKVSRNGKSCVANYIIATARQLWQ
jgi:hypothetical protein